MSRIEWDDLRYVLAVAAEGSLAGAARVLDVNHTTVLRRVNAFEERLGLRLFERLPAGYTLTAEGAELIEAARLMEDTVTSLERRLIGRDRKLSGSVRVTTTDTLASSILPGILAAFRLEHPGITIELSTSNSVVSLTRRAADVAIRPAENPPEALVGRRVSSLAFAVYAGAQYLAAHGAAAELSAHTWIGLDDSLADTSIAQWMRVALPGVEISLRTNSLLTARHAAAANLGVAALPCYLGDTADDILRLHPPLDAMTTALWVVTHEDLRRSARIRAFTEFCARAFARQRQLLEGKLPANHGR